MDKTKMSEHIQELCEAILRLENAEQCRAFFGRSLHVQGSRANGNAHIRGKAVFAR